MRAARVLSLMIWSVAAVLVGVSSVRAGVGCACNGDVTGDGVIDISDFTFVQGRLGCPVGTGNPQCDASDINCDGVVDAKDTTIILCQFLQPAPGDPACCDCACDGDVNGDGVINANDAIAVSFNVGCPVLTGDPQCDASDINCDGVVDATDVQIVECQQGLAAPGDRLCCVVCGCNGDVDGSGQIDLLDVSGVIGNIGCVVGSGDPSCDASDVNCDGIVDLRDVRVVECQVGQAAPGDPACCGQCRCTGDVNRDGIIDIQDFTITGGKLGCSVGSGDAVCDRADVNCDGVVDVRDQLVIQCQFGQAAPGDLECCDVCSCTGDVNGDLVVDAVDVQIIALSIGCVVGSGDPVCDSSDVDCDGVVDIRDFAIAGCQIGPGRGDPQLCSDEPGACCWGCVTYPGGPEFVCADLSRIDCAFAQGVFLGVGTDCASAACDQICRADLDGDNDVDVFDFGSLSANFGRSGTPGRCAGDLNCDGAVDVFDFGLFGPAFGCAGGPVPDQCCLGLASP